MLHRVSSQRGLTLIEIIVVLVILAIVFAFLTGGLIGKAETAKAQVSQMKLEKVKNAISQYQLMKNKLPANLRALVDCSSDQGGGACLKVAEDEDLKDAWDTPIVYQPDGSGRSFVLKSLGADHKDGGSGTDGDISIKGP